MEFRFPYIYNKGFIEFVFPGLVCMLPFGYTVLPRLVRRRTIYLKGFSLNVLNESSHYTRDRSII